MVSNALLFAVSLLASRWLGPAPYGVVGAMLALTVILTVPSLSFQILVAREIAQAGEDQAEVAAGVARARLRQSLILGLGFAGIAGVLSAPIASALNLGSVWPIILVALAAPLLLVMTVLRGVYQGTNHFGMLTLNLVVEGAGRLVAAAAALALGFGATGVTAAPAIGAGVAAGLSLVDLRAVIVHPVAVARRHLVGATWATAAFFAGFAVLSNTDVLVVKHGVDSVTAGEYAGVALFGKIVLLLPVAVGIVAVPEVAARAARGAPTLPLLGQAVGAVAASCAALTAAAYAAPSLVAALTVGGEFAGAEPLFGPYALAMLTYAVASIIVLYLLALNRARTAWATLAFAPAQALAMLAYEDRPEAIIWIMAATGALLSSLGVFEALRGSGQPDQNG